jgi:hypothetical protein
VGIAFVRKSWAALGVGLGLALCLSGCQQLFPRPAYTPPPSSGPAYPKPRRAQIARPTFYVAVKDHLNLRACPGMDCPKISVLNRNEEVEELGTAGDWSQVRVKSSGSIGWVYSRYLSANPLPALPPVTAPAPTPAPAPQVAPPPLPEIPETVKPAPAKPAVEKPPAKPEEGVPTEIKRKPEEAIPAKPAPPKKVVAPTPVKPEQPVKPEKPVQVEKPPKPAPASPAEKPKPPAPEPSPEKPSSIRIM